jgi:hypothetical protein
MKITDVSSESMIAAVLRKQMHDLDGCMATRWVDGKMAFICGKTRGHTGSQDAGRKEHFDADQDERWEEIPGISEADLKGLVADAAALQGDQARIGRDFYNAVRRTFDEAKGEA